MTIVYNWSWLYDLITNYEYTYIVIVFFLLIFRPEITHKQGRPLASPSGSDTAGTDCGIWIRSGKIVQINKKILTRSPRIMISIPSTWPGGPTNFSRREISRCHLPDPYPRCMCILSSDVCFYFIYKHIFQSKLQCNPTYFSETRVVLYLVGFSCFSIVFLNIVEKLSKNRGKTKLIKRSTRSIFIQIFCFW